MSENRTMKNYENKSPTIFKQNSQKSSQKNSSDKIQSKSNHMLLYLGIIYLIFIFALYIFRGSSEQTQNQEFTIKKTELSSMKDNTSIIENIYNFK